MAQGCATRPRRTCEKTLHLESKTVNSSRVTVVFQGTQKKTDRGASKEGGLEAVGCSGDTCRVVCDMLCGCGTRLVPRLLAGGISTMRMVFFVYRFSADLKINKGGNGGSLL